MLNSKILAKFRDGNEILFDLEELVYEKYGFRPDEIKGAETIKTYTKVEKRHFKKGEFYMESFAFAEFILEKKYNTTDLKLLLALKRRLDFNNRIKTFIQSELAEEIESHQANVSKSLKKFMDDGIIEKDGHDFYFNDRFIKGAGNSPRRKKL